MTRPSGPMHVQPTDLKTRAYSEDTDTMYPNWASLVEAEATGYAVVGIVEEPRQKFPAVFGPYPTKADADRARARLRRKWGNDPTAPATKWFSRVLWLDAQESEDAAVRWLHKRLFDLAAENGRGQPATPEIQFLIEELARKGWDWQAHLQVNEQMTGFGWLPLFAREGETGWATDVSGNHVTVAVGNLTLEGRKADADPA